ncbi:16S rRNA (cytosine(1402)-N(4))-methyltransferase RsmH [Flaviflagellibacter deserti]|uniref:Ribosomal RNA small subunit methyltransferase H n=1 Tax=Flaviflagellibacter deserti TaxID=2267266 RepID=A0ABV9Z3T2_9HYPH
MTALHVEGGAPVRHISVLRDEAVDALAPVDGALYIDGTFGAGGYSRALLEMADCRIVGIDRDREAIAGGASLVEASQGRLMLVNGRFGDLKEITANLGVERVDGIVLDVGVSSMQIDDAHRGFSFRFDGPLDMRMGGEGPSAADLVNDLSEKDLAALIRTLGEERRANAIAKAIVSERNNSRIETTLHLAKICETVLGRAFDQINPATRTFQALRIAVNDELGELLRALFAAEEVLAPGGRLAVVSFHSLEDRIVKTFLAERSRTTPNVSRHAPATFAAAPTFIPVVRSATPGDDEIARNPRSRSARLRAAERTDAPARGPSDSLAYGVPHLPALTTIMGGQ